MPKGTAVEVEDDKQQDQPTELVTDEHERAS